MSADGWPSPVRSPYLGHREDLVLEEIVAQRARAQIEFPLALDDVLPAEAWIAKLTKQVGKAVTLDPPTFRAQMVNVAAVALAAIEWYDRKYE